MTTAYKIGKAIDEHNNKMARIERLTNTLGAKEQERYKDIKHNVALGLARELGTHLSQTVTDVLLDEIILRPEIIAAVTAGSDPSLPKTPEQWDAMAHELVEGNAMAKLCVLSRSREEREAIKQEECQKLAPTRRLQMARNQNELDDYLENRIRERLSDKAGL